MIHDLLLQAAGCCCWASRSAAGVLASGGVCALLLLDRRCCARTHVACIATHYYCCGRGAVRGALPRPERPRAGWGGAMGLGARNHAVDEPPAGAPRARALGALAAPACYSQPSFLAYQQRRAVLSRCTARLPTAQASPRRCFRVGRARRSGGSRPSVAAERPSRRCQECRGRGRSRR
jgi:hypothetical protein